MQNYFEEMTKAFNPQNFNVTKVAADVESAQAKMLDQAEQNVILFTKAMNDGVAYWRTMIADTNAKVAEAYATAQKTK